MKKNTKKYKAKGDVFPAKGDVFEKAKGDVFPAKGDVFPAKGNNHQSSIINHQSSIGDVFPAKGDIFNAMGDVFKDKDNVFNANYLKASMFHKANPLIGLSEEEVDKIYEIKPYDQDYYDWLDYYYGEEEEVKKRGGFINWLGEFIDVTDKGVDTFLKLKEGGKTEKSGVELDYKLKEKPTKENNVIWYILGGVALIVVIMAVIASRKKK